jgi:hypothetical protein
MGVLSGKDLFSSKYLTAVIINSSMRSFFVPIKYVIGDYFLTVIDHQLYVFRLNEMIITYRHTLTKSFRWYLFTTDHYLPMAPSQLKELEMMLEKNDLPRINMMLFNILKYLGRREKHEFKPHKIEKLIEELAVHEDKYSEEIRQILAYLEHLNTDQVVTPVRKVSEFIEDNVLTPDPKFFGNVINFFKSTDVDFKKVNNDPTGAKKNWVKPLALIMVVVIVGVIGYMVYQSGFIQGMLPDFSQIKPLDLSGAVGGAPAQNLMERYPDPVDLRLACDRGEVDCSQLPQNIKDMIAQAELPKAVPKQQAINLTP